MLFKKKIPAHLHQAFFDVFVSSAVYATSEHIQRPGVVGGMLVGVGPGALRHPAHGDGAPVEATCVGREEVRGDADAAGALAGDRHL